MTGLSISLVAVLALPLLGFLVLTFGGRWLRGRDAGWIGAIAVGLAFAAAAYAGSLYGIASGEPAAEATASEAGESLDAAESGNAHGAAAPFELVLWRWIQLGTEEVRLTVARTDLEELTRVDAEEVAQVWWPLTPEYEELLPTMWSVDEVEGLFLPAGVAAGSVLTYRNVPSGGNFPGPFDFERRQPMSVDIRLQLDNLSLLMILVVTGVGFLIHLYSIGYMAHDGDIRRYFAYLNLFVFSMLTLVLAGDFLVLFVGWELVGLCSYLLIGFWYQDHANASAGRKAFIVNRVGDFGFLIGLMLIWTTFGSLAFADVLPAAEATLAVGGTTAVAIAACLLVGATGKSAQIPLYVWLPDAMAGPTPVSALIHAATMVTAGVYMIVRAHALFEQAPIVMGAIAAIGAATALLAAVIALVQVDIKKVLAYSTISQLGYMMMGVGAAAYVAGIFHLMTHAFFKALLFLGAGSVMHAMEHGFHHAPVGGQDGGSHEGHADGVDSGDVHGALEAEAESIVSDSGAGEAVPAEQDMRRMGGLWSKLRFTGPTFAIGSLALAGVVPFAGFWSKDEILLEVFAHGGPFWGAVYLVGLFTALLTAIYTGRALFMVFFGESRSDGARHAAESPLVMTVPLVILGILSVVGGVPGIAFGGGESAIADWLAPVVGAPEHAAAPKLMLALIATVVALGGLALAWLAYGPRRAISTERIVSAVPWAYRLAAGKFYVDELYGAIFVTPFRRLADFWWLVVDDGLIDGAVNAIGRAVGGFGSRIRTYQTGYVRSYALSMLAGAAVIAVYLWWVIR